MEDDTDWFVELGALQKTPHFSVVDGKVNVCGLPLEVID